VPKNDNKKHKVGLQTAFLRQTISRGLIQNEIKIESFNIKELEGKMSN
jgi:hypothetical protein